MNVWKYLFGQKPKRPPEASLLTESDSFCMMPFVHLHINQYGHATPCCQAPWDAKNSFGDIHTSSMEDIWNSPEMRTFRSRMVQGKKDERCARCYEKEASGWLSLREITNEKFSGHFKRVEDTEKNGKLSGPPIYFDLRFSNVCNFKCRICGPWASSKWHNDALESGMKDSNSPALILAGDSAQILAELEQYIDSVEEFYFAGGEPLVMEEHYAVLDLLIRHGRTDVRLFYNTNFSILRFRQKNVIEYWKQFPHINLAVSLDASGSRGEYLRSGQDWEETCRNRVEIIQEIPHAEFMISPTVYALNVLHLPDFHREWVEKGWIEPEDFIPTMLIEPRAYGIRVLPQNLKEQASRKIQEHISWLSSLQGIQNPEKLSHCIAQFRNILPHMNSEDHSHLLPELRRHTERLDQLRNEHFAEVFPELSTLFPAR